MIAPNVSSSCQNARLYYYDFLFNRSHGLVPESIADHIRHCPCCQEQLGRLEDVLSQGGDYAQSEREQAGTAVTTMLRLHFAYLGEPVTCRTVRPFLPSLLDPAFRILVPTPITAHLESCRQCADDLETIQGLRLSRRQLCRLSQLFAAKPVDDNVSCSQARTAIPAVVSLVLGEASEETLRHLCTCPDCRQRLYQFREAVRRNCLRRKGGKSASLCDAVSATDIFDYVVPYGIDPAEGECAESSTSLTSHLRTCSTCLGEMQQLHCILYGIAERAESEVITIFRVGEPVRAQARYATSDFYAGFPITVEITSRANTSRAVRSAYMSGFLAALKRRMSAVNLTLLAKTGLATAAFILIAAALLFNIPAAGAVTVEQIYKALEKVKNVHISKFVPGQMEPVEERWVSRALNTYLIKAGGKLYLYELRNGIRKERGVRDNSLTTQALSADDIARVRNQIMGTLGLLPFEAISEIPSDARWSLATAEAPEARPKDFEVYDLTWIERHYGGTYTFRRCRVLVDAGTSLPHRVETYRKSAMDSDYSLANVIEVEYPHSSEMEAVVENASLQDI